jgi:Flp pilus assembly protein TadG
MASKGQGMFLRRLARDRRGMTSVEFALVCVVFFMMIFGIIDFSRAMWEWNAAAKATHWGVRYAVVNDMVAIRMSDWDGLADGGLTAGGTVPVAAVTGFGPSATITCTNTECGGATDPDNDFNVNAFDDIVTRMQIIYDKIQPENVIVEYRHVGLGFAGNPLGPDLHPAVTIKLVGMGFDFVTPGLAGLFPITMPDFAATMTGEDLWTP